MSSPASNAKKRIKNEELDENRPLESKLQIVIEHTSVDQSTEIKTQSDDVSFFVKVLFSAGSTHSTLTSF